ncbi:amidase [Achromobacter xylosoxidans]
MPDQDTPLHFREARELARAIRDGAISSRQVTVHFLDRIERAPALAAYSQVTAERALAQAEAADRLLAAGISMGPLHGVPVALKDSLHWAGTVASGGSQTRSGVISDETAAAVRALAAQGMVILGKTRMTEFAFGLSGQNPTQGTARNPWDAATARAPGGSSSGAGVAVAAGLAPLAVGGDTGGSVRAPAALNGVVGYKPSSGVISRAGCLPLSETLDVLGPICRSVADARLLTQLLAGPDIDDVATLALPAASIAALRRPAARRGGAVAVLAPQARAAARRRPADLARSAGTAGPGRHHAQAGIRRRRCRSRAWRTTTRWYWPTRPTAISATWPTTRINRCGKWCARASPPGAASRRPTTPPRCNGGMRTWPRSPPPCRASMPC